MSHVIYEPYPQDGYALFTLNRPDRLNAIGGALMAELEDALRSFADDPALRVGILTGAGRAFCAGADIREGAERDAALAELRDRLQRGEIDQAQHDREAAKLAPAASVRFDLFSANPKPFIAALNGLAIGGGMHWAMDCDIRIAAQEAYLALTEPRIGMAAGYGSRYLGELVPFGEAMYILLTTDRVPADEAHRIGLVHEVLPQDRLIPRAVEIAGMIARNAPLAIQAAKALAWQARKRRAADLEADAQAISRKAMESQDVIEGRRAFIEKRPPRWQGR